MSLRLLQQSKLTHIVSSNQIRYFETIKQTRKEYIELEQKVANLSNNPFNCGVRDAIR